jgi:hypothetical protein
MVRTIWYVPKMVLEYQGTRVYVRTQVVFEIMFVHVYVHVYVHTFYGNMLTTPTS